MRHAHLGLRLYVVGHISGKIAKPWLCEELHLADADCANLSLSQLVELTSRAEDKVQVWKLPFNRNLLPA